MTMMCLWIICKHWLAFFLFCPQLSLRYLYNRAFFSLFLNFNKSSILWKFLWTLDINNSIIVIIWKKKHLFIFSQAFYIFHSVLNQTTCTYTGFCLYLLTLSSLLFILILFLWPVLLFLLFGRGVFLGLRAVHRVHWLVLSEHVRGSGGGVRGGGV